MISSAISTESRIPLPPPCVGGGWRAHFEIVWCVYARGLDRIDINYTKGLVEFPPVHFLRFVIVESQFPERVAVKLYWKWCTMLIRAIYGSPVGGISTRPPVLETAIDQAAVTPWFMPHHGFSTVWTKKQLSRSPSHSYFALQLAFWS